MRVGGHSGWCAQMGCRRRISVFYFSESRGCDQALETAVAITPFPAWPSGPRNRPRFTYPRSGTQASSGILV